LKRFSTQYNVDKIVTFAIRNALTLDWLIFGVVLVNHPLRIL